MQSTGPKVLSVFKLNGLSLKREAFDFLLETIQTVDQSNHSKLFDDLCDSILNRSITTTVIDKDTIQRHLKEAKLCGSASSISKKDDPISIVGAFDFKHFVYDKERKKFVLFKYENSDDCLHLDANVKSQLFIDRYNLVSQRLSRHDIFSMKNKEGKNEDSSTKTFELKPIEFLLGSENDRHEDVIVLGMIAQIKEGKFYLEDPTGFVPLDLTQVMYQDTGIYTEGAIVLAEGLYEDGVLHVSGIGLPPPETKQQTYNYFGVTNDFITQFNDVKVGNLQSVNIEDAMVVFLSDVWLDQIQVIYKLRKLFVGFESAPPTCFVFFGNFVSQSHGIIQAQFFKRCLDNLADVLTEFPTLIRKSRLIFVPGLRDIGLTSILPRPAISKILTADFCSRIPGAEFVTNPCRLTCFGQQILLTRDDLVTKFCRNSIYYPRSGKLTEHFVNTLASQAHLNPLMLNVCPVYWAYDHALSLYPLPDVVVCADKFDHYAIESADCSFVNPGMFSRNGFQFKVYFPATKSVEDSLIEDD